MSKSDDNLFIYPNPTNSTAMVYWGGNSASAVRLYSSHGYLVYETEITQGEKSKELLISHLTSGLYFVEVGGVSRKLIIKN